MSTVLNTTNCMVGPHGPALHARRGERERSCPHAPPAHSATTRDAQDIGGRRGFTTRRTRARGSVSRTVSHRQAVNTRSTQTHHAQQDREGGRGDCLEHCPRQPSCERGVSRPTTMCRSQWELVLPRSPIPPACSLTLRHAERPVPPHHIDRLATVKVSDRVG